jgi:GT2 family glycosyltransferase
LFSGTTIFDEPHHLALELLAAKALADNNAERAFELSDRRCRIRPTPQPHCYLLRAEASFRLGQKSYALDDLGKVLETSPDDLEANRRMLVWSKGRRRRTAAVSLLKNDGNTEVLRRALQALSDGNDRAHASITVFDGTIEGWAAWGQGQLAEVSIQFGNEVKSIFVEPDPFHPLSSECFQAAGFVLARPRLSEPQLASVTVDGRLLYSIRMPGNDLSHRHLAEQSGLTATADVATPDVVTVIVPIYADYQATRTCVESLLKAIGPPTATRIVLVDDATTDLKIKRYLAAIAKQSGVKVLTNARNSGFVGSINRALQHVRKGDVILLNSDTVVPPGFVDRLRATAESAPDIGTVNPLSNNGEFSSFPIPNEINDLGTLEEVIALDQLAAETNSNRIVDLPSGIGFCLYVTRTCLDAVGFLSEKYQRGYLEDVDFCLRAREAGFRSVCATSVYVGHAGSRSFKSEKRSLVVRNLEVLDRKFPTYRNECSAFAIADPLKTAREAIERRLRCSGSRPKLIVTGEGTVGEIAEGRADELVSRGQDTIILKLRGAPSGPTACLRNVAGTIPQNIEFDISQSDELQSLDAFLKQADLKAIEIVDPASVPSHLLDLLVNGRAPYEILLADAGLLCPPGGRLEIPTAGLASNSNKEMRKSAQAPGILDLNTWRNRWHAIAAGAEHILAPCPVAKAFGELYLPGLTISTLQASDAGKVVPRSRPWPDAKLGILALRASAEEFISLRGLTRELLHIWPDLPVVIIGETLDDRVLMQQPNVFVTGPVDRVDVGRVLVQYKVQWLLTGLGQPLFGHPLEREALQSGLPTARFDWSFGRHRPLRGDLAILPDLECEQVAGRLVQWIEGQ